MCPRTGAPVDVGPCGTRIDRWEVERLLGSGGFGAVYVARHTVLGQRVAMKLLREGRVNDDSTARFVREARAAAAVGSPHVVRVTDFGQAPDGCAFLVMELLEGSDLERILKGAGTLPPDRAVDVARQMLDGLAAAHRAGVVHRDLKPANVFLAREGSREIVKVVDFGISKSVDPSEQTITRTGVVVGTPAYMPPEQLKGEGVDPRSDVYAAAAVLYQMLSGRLPHEAPSFELLVLRVCTEDSTPLRNVMPQVDPQLAAVVERGLARDRAMRWPSADAFADALARLPATSLSGAHASPLVTSPSSPLVPPTAVTPMPLSSYAPPTPSPQPFASSVPAVPAYGAPAMPVQSWHSVPVQTPPSVRPIAPPTAPQVAPAPKRSITSIVALGCAALVLGGITMGAIAFVTTKLLSTTREPIAQVAVPAAQIQPTLPAGGKPPATPDDDGMPATIHIGPGGSLHIGGGGDDDMPDVDVDPPHEAPPPAMPPRGAHVFVDEPEITSQNIPSDLVHRVVVESQSDFDGCRGATATRVQSQVFFGFGEITMSHAAYDNPGDHGTAECIAHRFAEHMGHRCHGCDGIITLWSNVPAR
jgi:serine/threonine-protein kinase